MKKIFALFFVILCCLLTACSSPETISGDTAEVKSIKGVYDVDMTVKNDNGTYTVVITNNTEDCAVSNNQRCDLYRQNGTDWEEVKQTKSTIAVYDTLELISPFENNNTIQWPFEAVIMNEGQYLTPGKYKIRVYITVYDPVEWVALGEDENGPYYGPKYKEKDAKEYYIETTFTVDER